VTGGELIREARKRAGMTQRELAVRLGTTQAVVARWETGAASPSFARVQEAVRACGFDLAVRVVARDDEHVLLIEGALRLTPEERLARASDAHREMEDLAAAVTRSDL
jgi:transcriptional regulator with XRE-family HTH domain